MFPDLSSTARAVTYYLLALGLCAALALLIPDGQAASVLAMLTPTMSVLLMQLVVTRDGWHRGGWTSLGLSRLGRNLWPVAVALPLGVLVLSESAVLLTGLTSWHLPSVLDATDLMVEVPVTLVFVLFEEIGWRGYLSPLLAGTNRRPPHLITGLLHGIWHLPIVFLAGNAYLTEGNRWIIVPVFLAVLTCTGPIYGWTRQVSGSIYPAVILHATFDAGLSLIAVTVTTAHPDAVATLGREAGILTLVVVAAAAAWVSTWPLRPLLDPRQLTPLVDVRLAASLDRAG
jgi:membrane protease YdiL (CAAX protease family)